MRTAPFGRLCQGIITIIDMTDSSDSTSQLVITIESVTDSMEF
jgi:hypothetical protein